MSCKYCQNEFENKTPLLIVETDYYIDERFIDENGIVNTDWGHEKQFNYCPMCGRKL